MAGNRRHRRPPRAPIPDVTIQARVESIASGGEGVGRLPDGRAVFIHRTAPGELVEATLIASRPRWARGRLLEVLEPSPDRRPAPCPHYHECGGCTLEHLVYPAQLAAKSRIVQDALERIGGLATAAPEVIRSPDEHHYRNRVSFALRRLGNGRVLAGFHALHHPDRIVQIDGSCQLPEEPIGEVWDRIRQEWGPDAELLPSGERLRLTLRTTTREEVSLLVEGGDHAERLEELVARVDGLESVWHRPEGGTAGHAAGAPGLPETWGEDSFTVGGAAFLQVNRKAAEGLEKHVLKLAGDTSGLKVIDAYCGIGIHGRRLARLGAEVIGIELDPEAIAVATALSGDPGPRLGTAGSRYLCGRVEDHLGDVLPADLVILNPPRAGLDESITAHLLGRPPARIIYVSCDPATLARDIKRLNDGFRLESILSFDLFPQTAHVESVALLHRLNGPG